MLPLSMYIKTKITIKSFLFVKTSQFQIGATQRFLIIYKKIILKIEDEDRTSLCNS